MTKKTAFLTLALGLFGLVLWGILGARAIERVYVSQRGTESDFYLVWRGADALWHGENPYTDSVTQDIQMKILGHLVAPGENEYRFVYPAYEAFVFLPFSALDYYTAYLYWLTFQPVFFFLALSLIIHSLSWRLSPRALAALILLGFSSRYFWIGMSLAQTSTFILVLLALSAYLAKKKREVWIGAPLVLATVKPQLAVFPLLGWLIWMLSRRRWRGVALAGGIGLALLILPTFWIGCWIPNFYHQVSAYWGYTHASSPLTLLASLLPNETLRNAAVVLFSLVGVISFILLAARSKTWMPVLSAGILLTILIVPLSYVYDQALLLLPWLFIMDELSKQKERLWSKIQFFYLSIPLWSWGIFLAGKSLDAILWDKLLPSGALLLLFLLRDGTQS